MDALLEANNQCELAGIDFNGEDFRGADFRKANVSRANFSGADIRGVDFSGADMRGTDLSGSFIKRATFIEAKYNYHTDFPGIDRFFYPEERGMIKVD